MIVYFGRIPIEETALLYLSADTRHKKASPFAEQQKLARQLLANPHLQGICVAPLRDTTKLIVFGQKGQLDPPCQSLERFILDFNLSISSVKKPDYVSVESAVKFTFYYWMEKEGYAKVGDFLMLHDDLFSPTHEGIPQISVTVNISPLYELNINFSVKMVRISILEEWLMGKGSQSSEQWSWVLPKLGRGRVVGAHRALPAHSPFATYNQLRDYWKDSYGYTLPPRAPDCYYDVKFNGPVMRNTFLYPYFLVWAKPPETIRFVESVEVEKKLFKEFLLSMRNCCQGRMLAGLEIDLMLRSGQVNQISASVVSLQQRQRMLPKLGPFRPNAPYKKPIIVASTSTDGSEEEAKIQLKQSKPPKWQPKMEKIEYLDRSDEASEEDREIPSVSRSDSLKPIFGYKKVSQAEVAKSIAKKRVMDSSLTSDLEPMVKREAMEEEGEELEEKPTFSGWPVYLQIPPSATQFGEKATPSLAATTSGRMITKQTPTLADCKRETKKARLADLLATEFIPKKASKLTELPPNTPKLLMDQVSQLPKINETSFPGALATRRVGQPAAGSSNSRSLALQISQSRTPHRVVLSDGIDPIQSTPRKTPRRLPNIDF